MTSRGYVTVLEADIRACFDQIDHGALMGQMRQRVGDKKVLALVKAFLKAGIMTRDGQLIGSNTGTPIPAAGQYRASRMLPNSRNGSYPKMLASQVGDVDLAIPRDQNGTFTPQLVPKDAAASRSRHRARGGHSP